MCGRPQVLSEAFCYPGDQQPLWTGWTTKCNRVCMGKAQLRRKATTNTDFWLKSLFSQREGCEPGWAVLSPRCSKATDTPLMAEG